MRTHRVGVIYGDGIGPEIIGCALDALRALEELEDGLKFEFHRIEAGAAYYQQTGDRIDHEALAWARAECAAILKGPTGHPDVRAPDGTEAGLLGEHLRIGLDLYANVRPIRLLPGVEGPLKRKSEVDYVIVRENTEGLYASRGKGVGNERAMVDQLFMTREGVERVVELAFERAGRRDRNQAKHAAPRVTCVDKSNVLRVFAFFRSIFDEVAERYPDIESDHAYADAVAQTLVTDPDHFDVLVMENFLGDILSDLGGATVGGVGMCPSGNLGEGFGVFEPTHGSAPTLQGLNLANPVAQLLSAAMLLEFVGEPSAAALLEAAVSRACGTGAISFAPDGTATTGTVQAGEAVIAALR